MRATLRTIGLATAATLATTVAATAADKLATAPAPPPVVVPVFTWSGPYLGLQGGVVWDNYTSTVAIALPALIGSFEYRTVGTTVGIYGGYNMQFGVWVLGVDGSYNWDFVKDGHYDAGMTSDTEWHGLLRAKVGVAAGSTFLLYATGGVAFANLETNATDAFVAGPTQVRTAGSDEKTETGWTAGFGLEMAFTPNLIGRMDYAYVHYNDFVGSAGNLIAPAPPGPNTYKTILTSSILTWGVALKY